MKQQTKQIKITLIFAGILLLSMVLAMPGAAETVKPGGTLRVGQTSDILGQDPTELGQNSELLYRQVFDTLITEKKDGSLDPEPLLAKSWEWSEDKLKLRLHLQEQVKFHSGREFTAEDVIANIKHVQNPETGSKLRASSSSIVRMEAIGKYTVDLSLSQPTPALFDMFTMLWMIDPDAMGTDNAMVGTGPFEWVEWIPGTHVKLKRFAGYWDGDLPYLDEIIITAEPDAQTMVASLESGTLDLIKIPPRNEITRLDAEPGLKVHVSPVGNTFYAIAMNTQAEVLNDKKVRQALAHTMDRPRFVETFLHGSSFPQSIPYASQSSAYDPELVDYYAFDLEKARKMLADAGYPDGFNLRIMVAPALDEALLKFSLMWQQDLAKIGIDLQIDQTEVAVWLDNKRGGKFPSLQADLYGRAQKEPISLYTESLPFLPGKNPARFVSERYRELVAAAAKEPDDAKRLAIYKDITALLLDEAFQVPLAPQTRIWAIQEDVMGFDYNIDNREVFRATWLNR